MNGNQRTACDVSGGILPPSVDSIFVSAMVWYPIGPAYRANIPRSTSTHPYYDSRSHEMKQNNPPEYTYSNIAHDLIESTCQAQLVRRSNAPRLMLFTSARS